MKKIKIEAEEKDRITVIGEPRWDILEKAKKRGIEKIDDNEQI